MFRSNRKPKIDLNQPVDPRAFANLIRMIFHDENGIPFFVKYIPINETQDLSEAQPGGIERRPLWEPSSSAIAAPAGRQSTA